MFINKQSMCDGWCLRAAVVPLHTQRFATIGCFQQFELQCDGRVQVTTHKRLVVVDGNSHHWGVHYWVSGKPGRKKQNKKAKGNTNSINQTGRTVL